MCYDNNGRNPPKGHIIYLYKIANAARIVESSLQAQGSGRKCAMLKKLWETATTLGKLYTDERCLHIRSGQVRKTSLSIWRLLSTYWKEFPPLKSCSEYVQDFHTSLSAAEWTKNATKKQESSFIALGCDRECLYWVKNCWREGHCFKSAYPVWEKVLRHYY